MGHSHIWHSATMKAQINFFSATILVKGKGNWVIEDSHPEILNIWRRGRMSQRPSGCRSCLKQNTFRNTHTAGCPLPLRVPRNRCCATSCLAPRLQPPPPCLARPLSPALHRWSLAGKNAMGPPSLPLPQSRVNTKIWQSQIKTACTLSIITL